MNADDLIAKLETILDGENDEVRVELPDGSWMRIGDVIRFGDTGTILITEEE